MREECLRSGSRKGAYTRQGEGRTAIYRKQLARGPEQRTHLLPPLFENYSLALGQITQSPRLDYPIAQQPVYIYSATFDPKYICNCGAPAAMHGPECETEDARRSESHEAGISSI